MGRQEWLEQRRKGLGGSDIAAIMGISKWSTPMDIYLDKMGLSEDKDSNAKSRGRWLEPAIANWFAETHGLHINPGPEMPVQGEKDFMLGSPDFWVWDDDGGPNKNWGLEVKTSRDDGGWGTEGTDEIPAYYATQVHWYMLVTGKDVWDVAVYFTLKDEFRHYRLVKDDDLHAKMLETAEAWWNKHIVGNLAPEIDGGDGSVTWLNHQHPEDTGEVREPTIEELELIEELNSINDRIKALRDRKDTTENMIKEQMQDCSVLNDEHARVSWKLGKGRKTFDSKRFRGDHPRLAEEYMKVSNPARSFRFKYKQDK